MSEHVVRRGNRYYYRRRVPVELVALYGKSEHQQALGTAKRSEADKLARQAAVELDRIFDKLHAELKTGDDTSAAQITEIYDPVTGTWYKPRNPSIGREDVGVAEQEMQESAAHFEEPLAAQYVNHDTQLARNARLAKRRQQRIDEMKEAIRAVRGDTHAPIVQAMTASLDAPQRPAKAAPAIIETRPSDRSLGTLARMWEKARKPTSGVAYATHRTVARFNTMVGQVPVHRITKAQVVQFKDAMVEEAIGHTAITAALNSMRTLCAFAIGQAWIDANPATGVKLEGRKRVAKALRPPFDTATLGRIFNGRVYTQNYRPESGRGEAIYWLPLLGLYTGARVEELVQLRPEDVYEESYRDGSGKDRLCWVIRVTDNEDHGQGVKNEHSRRRIPIHQELLKRGFVEYATKHKGQPRIFPGMKPDKHGAEASAWSKWWIREYLRKECAPTSPKMVYHSFRHTFKDVCRECGISKEVADALQGHSEGDASSSYGGEFYPLRPLIDAMARYEIHGLTIPA